MGIVLRGKERWDTAEKKIFLTVVVAIVSASLATFIILYWMMNGVLIEDIQTRAHVVNLYASKKVNPKSFFRINEPADMEAPLYASVQQELDRVRILANVRYLYTAKRRADGHPVYLVDGLPPDSEDFRNAGVPIEDDILPQLNRCLDGQAIESDRILETEWGAIFITCTPFVDKGKTIGAIVMEFDADAIHNSNKKAMLYSAALSSGFVVLFIFITTLCLKRLASPLYRKLAYTDQLTGIANRTAFEVDMQKLETESCLSSIILVSYDLNNLKQINDIYGHASGDIYIKAMAAQLEKNRLVSRGKTYRIGGDEFASIFIGEQELDLKKRLQEFHDQCAAITVGEHKLSFAYGMARYEPIRDKGSLHNTLIRSDALMYQFKNAQRLNCPHSCSERASLRPGTKTQVPEPGGI